VSCTADSQCSDDDPCTTDKCNAGTCTHGKVPNCCKSVADCNDGDTCTADSCDTNTNACTHAKVPNCCKSVADCNDGDTCTADSCDTNTNACTHAKILNCCKSESDCDDGNPCNTDACVNNVCQHAEKCSADEKCEAGECLPLATAVDEPVPPATVLILPSSPESGAPGVKIVTLSQMNVNQDTILPGCSTAIKFVVVSDKENCQLFCTNGFCCGGMCCPVGLECFGEKCTIPKSTELISPTGETWLCGENMTVETGYIDENKTVIYIVHFEGQVLTTQAEETAGKKRKTRDEIAGLNWEGSTLNLVLYAPNGTMIPSDINNSIIEHKKGPTYDYYILKNAPPGNWTLKVVPIDVPKTGENYTLLTGGITREEDVLKVKAEETAGKKRKTRDEIAGLNWEGSTLDLILLDPNNNMVPTTGFNRTYVEHMKGPTYDYYLLRNATPGNWTMEITAVDVDEGGETFNIVNGPVKELVPIDLSTLGKK